MRSTMSHIIVVICVLVSPQFASASQCAAKVYFGNGIATTEDDARTTSELVRDVLNQALVDAGRQQLPFDCFDYAYATDSSVPYLGDLIESAVQIVLDDYSKFWQWLAGRGSDPPNTFEEAVQTAFASVSAVEYATSVDLQMQVQKYRTTINTDHARVVVIAHSQGNLFANQAFTTLSTGADGLAPISAERFRITAVATPQHFVATGDDWTTLFGDIILAVPARLPANTETDGTDCISVIPQLPGIHPIACHLFDSSYFLDSSVYSRPRIISQVLSQISESTTPEPEAWHEDFESITAISQTACAMGSEGYAVAGHIFTIDSSHYVSPINALHARNPGLGLICFGSTKPLAPGSLVNMWVRFDSTSSSSTSTIKLVTQPAAAPPKGCVIEFSNGEVFAVDTDDESAVPRNMEQIGTFNPNTWYQLSFFYTTGVCRMSFDGGAYSSDMVQGSGDIYAIYVSGSVGASMWVDDISASGPALLE
jgi:hypothetical protein